MSDWATISSLATAGGTLVLAVATFSAVRSASRSTRLAELALQEQLRPVLVHSHLDDPLQRIMFADGRWVQVPGSGAALEEGDGNLYLALSLRNVGAGIAILQGWHPWPAPQISTQEPPDVGAFRMQTRDFYVPPGGVGLWQAALRDPTDEVHGQVRQALAERQAIWVDLLYSDQTATQQTISRFGITPTENGWSGAAARHWNLDSSGTPRGRRPADPTG